MKHYTNDLDPTSNLVDVQSDTPLSNQVITHDWPVLCTRIGASDQFFLKGRRRLLKGALQYGDDSLKKPPALVIDESQEESIDIPGWLLMIWCRCETQELRQEIEAISRTACELYDRLERLKADFLTAENKILSKATN